MKRNLVLCVLACLLVFAVSNVYAADCSTFSTLSALISAGSCTSQDKIFANFAYTPTGPGSLAANQVATTLVFAVLPGLDEHGWKFTPVQGQPVWTNGFTLDYDISVAPAFPNVRITQAVDQMLADGIPSGTTITDTQTAPVGNLVLNNLSPAGLTAQSSGFSLTTIHTHSVATLPQGSMNVLESYEQDWFEITQTQIPEPISLILLGTGLAGVGLYRRIRKA